MPETSLSLLERIRQSGATAEWNRLAALYTPLLEIWVRKYDVQPSDTDDLVQEVLIAVAKDLPAFEHNGKVGAFRAWLKSIMLNRLRMHWRARGRRPDARGDSNLEQRLQQLEDPASEMSRVWDREHDRHVARQLLAVVEPHFAVGTWRAFTRTTLEGASADVVAAELNISLNAVFIAKSRVLNRLRREAEGLVESASTF